jgi:hypothetical protein
MSPEPVAGAVRSTAVIETGEGLNPKLGEAGMLPAVIVCAWAAPASAAKRERTARALVKERDIGNLR